MSHSFRSAGKALELAVGRVRSYLLPSHIRTYREIVRRPAQTAAGQKYACYDFNGVEIDNVGGRYLYSLVRDFEALGFQSCYRKNFRFLATMRHKEHKRLLLDRPFGIYESLDAFPPDSVAVEVTDRAAATPLAHRRVRVLYEERWPRSKQEVPMNFFVYPPLHERWLASPPPDLAVRRSWRVFFAGRVLDAKYKTDVLPEKFGKMSRQQVLQALESALPPARLRRIQTAADLEPGAEPAFYWADMVSYKIPQSEWLEALARADFFLACPGMDMPLCHNLIEAMSRGVVPILEHPEFLDPPLEPEVNCLAFRGRDELIRSVERAFGLESEAIQHLRRGACAYYEKHLAPGRFARRLLDLANPTVDLLLNAYRAPKGIPPK